MKKAPFLFFFILLFSYASFSQVPGYMGMRWSVYGNIETFFNLSNKNQWDNLYSVNLKYRAGIDYVLSKKNSLAVEYEYFQTASTYDPTNVSVVSDDPNGNNIFDINVRTMTVGLNYSWFNSDKGYIAPYGFYQQVGLRYLLCATTNEFGTMDRLSSAFTFANYQTAVITYGFGKRWIFFDRLLLHAGFEFGYVIGANPLGMLGSGNYQSSYLNSDENYSRTINRLSALYLVNFNIGLGFLLF